VSVIVNPRQREGLGPVGLLHHGRKNAHTVPLLLIILPISHSSVRHTDNYHHHVILIQPYQLSSPPACTYEVFHDDTYRPDYLFLVYKARQRERLFHSLFRDVLSTRG
jgi:hypothetical protein